MCIRDSVASWQTVEKQNHVLIDAMLSNANHYNKIINLPQFTSMHPKSKIAIGLLAYKFTKLGDNLTNSDKYILIYISNFTQNI